MFGEDLSDANLYRRVRRGDRRAFDALVRRHDGALRRLASRLLAEPDKVDAVLLKAYTRAWRTASLARVAAGRGGTVANWLYRGVYNACVDELRSQDPWEGPDELDGPRPRLPLAPAERRLSALRALEPGHRIPLVLVDGEGFTVEAVARILQRRPDQVAADLATARRRWRDMVIGPPDPARVAAADGEDAGDAPEAESAEADAPEAETPGAEAATAAAASNGDGDHTTSEQGEAGDGAAVGEAEVEASGNGSDTDQDGLPAVPALKRSPEISDPEDVTYAAEGAFDAEGALDNERFSSLKRWFRNRGSSDTAEAGTSAGSDG